MDEFKTLMGKARQVAKGSNPSEAWSRLREWAGSQGHPSAMKAAVFQFLELHGTRPEAISAIPDVLRSASALHLEGPERRNLIDLTERSCNSLELRLASNALPVSGNRPAPAFFLNPMKEGSADIYAPLAPTRDPEKLIQARDTILHVNIAIRRKVKEDEKRI